MISLTEIETRMGSSFTEKEDVVPVAVSEKEIVLARAPKLEEEKLQKISFQLFRYDNKAETDYLYKFNIQLKIDNKYYDFTSDVSARLDSFKRFGTHYTDQQIDDTKIAGVTARNELCHKYSLFKKDVLMGKIRKKNRKYKKGKRYKTPTIPDTYATLCYVQEEEAWYFIMKFENVTVEEFMYPDDLTPSQLNKNAIAQHIWYPPIVFPKNEIWVAEW